MKKRNRDAPPGGGLVDAPRALHRCTASRRRIAESWRANRAPSRSHTTTLLIGDPSSRVASNHPRCLAPRASPSTRGASRSAVFLGCGPLQSEIESAVCQYVNDTVHEAKAEGLPVHYLDQVCGV